MKPLWGGRDLCALGTMLRRSLGGFGDPFSPPPSLDEFSGLETDTEVPTEEAYVIYDEGTGDFQCIIWTPFFFKKCF